MERVVAEWAEARIIVKEKKNGYPEICLRPREEATPGQVLMKPEKKRKMMLKTNVSLFAAFPFPSCVLLTHKIFVPPIPILLSAYKTSITE